MKNLSIEFCRGVKAARREACMTQGELAAEVGCKQSALSMFEQGDGTKLNDEVIDKLAQKFNLSYTQRESVSSLSPCSQQPAGKYQLNQRGFCPNPHCPSNHEYLVEGTRLFRPDREAADPVGGKYCAVCGELLEKRCPNCGAAVHDGAICSFCGQPYISAV